ncbi:DUF7282 domain-containing protein [Halosimplex salinum]|uniref:DUF7282 domain-containing protein n=1 Tax=Halosimplex salinum TaxID=1710538 RepID=UPI000F4605D1|nr:BGTF surface domain-containing protein [Halosimplex salinum]
MTGTNDKLRSLFLTVLMVVSVFGGTVAFAGTAAAANTDPGVTSATESNNAITVEFNRSGVESLNSEAGDVAAEDVEVYIRSAGSGEFVNYSTDSAADFDLTDVTTDETAGENAEVVLGTGNGWGNLSPADEVKVQFNNLVSTGSSDGLYNTGNVSVDLSAATLAYSNNDYNTEGSAQRVYQGTPITIDASGSNTEDGSADNTPFLFQNADTNSTILEGSTGEDAQRFVFNTDRLSSGDTYRLVFNPTSGAQDIDNTGDRKVKYITIDSLQLSASLDQDGSLFEHNEDVELDVSGDAIRGNSRLAVTIDGPSTKYEEARLDNGGNIVDASYSYSPSDVDAGDYTVTVTDVKTGVDVTAGEFSVDEFPSASSASFGGGVFEEERGDVVEIPINLQNSEEGAQATVQVGSKSETNYVTNVTVADEDGDGQVVLEWNTYMTGTNISERIFSAQGDDNVTNFGNESGAFMQDLRQAAADNGQLGFTDVANAPDSHIDYAAIATIDAASYDLAVVANDEDDDLNNFNFTEVDEDDVGAVSINSRSTESSDVWVVPAGKTDQVDLQFIDENTDNTEDDIDGNLTQSDQATEGELIVHQVSASGLEGILRNRTDAGTNATQAFLNEESNYVENNANIGNLFPTFTAAFEELEPQANRQPRTFDLDTTNTVVIPDYQNDTYYIAVKLSGVDEDKLVDNDAWNASFGFEEYDAIGPVLGGEGGGTVDSEWTYYDAEANLQTNADDEVIIRNEDSQTIRGDTNVAPGTKLGLRINSQEDTSPFLTTLNTHVSEDRTFAASGDFSQRGAGINFTVNVRRGGDRIGGPYDGRILGEATASVTFNDQAVPEENQEVRVESATLSDGGFIAIHEGSASGDVIGTSRYLEPGQHSNVRIDLDEDVSETTTLVAMPHLDDNSNNLYDFPEADAPYTADGGAVTDSASVSLDVDTPTPTPTATPTDTPSPTPTPTDEPTDTPTDEPTDTPTDEPADETDEPEDTPTPTTEDDGAGFGVAVSLIALLGAALIAARRRD